MNQPKLARDMIRSYVERVERLHEERKALADDVRDIYAEAKSNGFDVPTLRTVIQRRARGADAVAEMDALIQTYEAALEGRPEKNAPATTATRTKGNPRETTPTRACAHEAAPAELRPINQLVPVEIDTSIPEALRVGSPENEWLRPGGKAA